MAETGLDFRATAGFVTDPAGFTDMIGDLYPATRGGFTFGYTAGALAIRDRDAGINPRLAGLIREDSGAGLTIRIDLPAAGQYQISLALGDASFTTGIDLTVKDNSTTLFNITGTTAAAGNFFDANGTEWSTAAWPGSNTRRTVTFASTIVNLVFGVGILSPLATIGFEAVGGATSPGYIGPFGWK